MDHSGCQLLCSVQASAFTLISSRSIYISTPVCNNHGFPPNFSTLCWLNILHDS